MPSQLGLSIEKVLRNIDLNEYVSLTDKVPLSPQAFYESLGYLRHPKMGLPVSSLASYQIRAFNAFICSNAFEKVILC